MFAITLFEFEQNFQNGYPTYRKNQFLENTGEVLVLRQQVAWDFFTENTDTFNVFWGDQLLAKQKRTKTLYFF